MNKFNIGEVVIFNGPFNTKNYAYIVDIFYKDNKECYKLDLGFSATCLQADINSISKPDLPKYDNKNNLILNELYFDPYRNKLVRVELVTNNNFILVKDIISSQKYITDYLEDFNSAKYNKYIIDWSNKFKYNLARIIYGPLKNKTVYIMGNISLFNHRHKFSGFFVYCIPDDKSQEMYTCLPDELEIIKEVN